MHNPAAELALARVLSYSLIGVAGILLGICTMLIHNQAKVEQERSYFNHSRLQFRMEADEVCTARIEKMFARCRCVPEVH